MTSWQPVADWYDKIVSKEGHYFHKNVILPKLKPFLKGADSVLDLACGQGILARTLPKKTFYTGVDISRSLIKSAEKNQSHTFLTADVTKPLKLDKAFSHAVCMLAMQNLEHPEGMLKNAFDHLKPGGELLLILNHPCFRIPRQTHWCIDEKQKLQFRRINCYMSPLKIPIQIRNKTTTSFHYPLSAYFEMLKRIGFVTLDLQEWVSDKQSEGGRARMENRARREFPLFLFLHCRK